MADRWSGVAAPREQLIPFAIVGALLVLGQAVLLPAVSVPAPHSGGDNMAYLALAHALVEGHGYVELWDPATPAHTKYPPGYPLVLSLLMGLGATTWGAFKVSSAAALSAATLLVLAWASHRRGVLAGGALALVLALAAGWQEASRWILSEPWFLAWTFLALWAGDRALGSSPAKGAQGANAANATRTQTADAPNAAAGPDRLPWALLAGVGAVMAFGVRTAGLPVVLALLVAFLAGRRFRAAAVLGGVSAVAIGGWAIHAARGGEGAYQSEFWLRNPYDPALGTVGAGGLLERVWTNLQLYVTGVLPAEWWAEGPGWALVALGLGLVLLTLGGWILRLREAAGPAEVFLPLYGGMILLWPEVWSGDRFLLPLVPLILLYGGEAVARGVERLHGRFTVPGREGRGSGSPPPIASRLAIAMGVLILALPGLAGTLDRAGQAADCRAAVDATGDAFACHHPGVLEFRAAATWMGANLPGEGAVLSRKPRIMYALGGPPGRTFPFTRDPERFLAEADAVGARYLLLDRWDRVASQYLVPVISGSPGAFCYLAGWGSDPEGSGTQLFGILPAGDRPPPSPSAELGRCPGGWADDGPDVAPEPLRVPLLVRGSHEGSAGLDSGAQSSDWSLP